MKINEAFLTLPTNYLFSTMSDKILNYKKEHLDAKIISLGIGDVSLPISKTVINKMIEAVTDLASIETFKGYGPETGYSFLIESIINFEYRPHNINFRQNEIFIGDGINSDIVNILDIFGADNIIAIQDPVYPVYVDSTIIKNLTQIDKIVFLKCNEQNNFVPDIPDTHVDIIYLCSPNNPTGMAFTYKMLKSWVDYAIKHNSLILFDAAYCAFIEDEDIPKTIYEIPGAKGVAIEFRSFSKTAGFTGVRCSYCVIPNELVGSTNSKEKISLNTIYKRRQSSNSNGVSYISQKGANGYYSVAGFYETSQNILYYKENAKLIFDTLKSLGYDVYGGINSPYVWFKINNGMTSWQYFDYLLDNVQIVGTPGSGFGKEGEHYFRFSAFNTLENTKEALQRFISLEQKK